MSRLSSKLLIIVAIICIGSVCLFYSYWFGLQLSQDHKSWAEFGDFFGGILNPVLAFLALLALLLTLNVQALEFRHSVQQLQATAQTAQEELELLKSEKFDGEVMSVLSDANMRIDKLLQQVISHENMEPKLTLFHIAMEGIRLTNAPGQSPAYKNFLKVA